MLSVRFAMSRLNTGTRVICGSSNESVIKCANI